ncbi:MAG: hypothetical protein ACD_15C00202G0016 [uncultured bacterium]|nr:MAG: hypothetical protein ACD_15C00202G0016 [uncultured bacterium]
MHQTFYIDIDEEITSIVDRLRKSKSKEVIIVVPKRAILIQSIVNLKLLKKEADNFKKELIIVTQDKLGKMLIEKAGIEVEQKLDDIDGWEIDEMDNFDKGGVNMDLANGIVNENIGKSKKNFDKIGSTGYYQSESVGLMAGLDAYPEKRNQEIPEESEEKILNKELVTDVSTELKKQQPSFRKNNAKSGFFAPMDMIRNVEIVEKNSQEMSFNKKMEKNTSKEPFKQEPLEDLELASEDEFSGDKEEKIERVGRFFENRKSSNSHEDEYRSVNVGSKIGKYFFMFSLVAILAIMGLAAYLFLPKASINVSVKSKTQSIEAQIDGNSNAREVDVVNEVIPVKAVTLTDEISKSYETTGSKDSSNQKAKGTITIYNEFSTSPQPLVATTRFESTDKKVFRLVSSVTVPGMEKVGSENKPGAIEAEVIADESGEEYNIEPGSFSIPGFESSGSEKFTKIYAKSFKAMIGGGKGSQKVKIVSDEDIRSAKSKALQELKTAIIQKLKDSVGKEYTFLDDAIGIDDAVYTQTKSSGDIADNFSITVKARASAIVFKESDIKVIVSNSISKKGEKDANIPDNLIKLDFGKADVDFKQGSIVIRVHATGSIIPEINLEKMKEDLLGKNENEIEPYIKERSNNIEKIEVIYWPSFMTGKIPAYGSRVDITLDQQMKSI